MKLSNSCALQKIQQSSIYFDINSVDKAIIWLFHVNKAVHMLLYIIYLDENCRFFLKSYMSTLLIVMCFYHDMRNDLTT